jgi:hypothetical protein
MIEPIVKLGFSLFYASLYLYFIKKRCLGHLKDNFGFFMICLTYLFIIYNSLSIQFIVQSLFNSSFIFLLLNPNQLSHLSNYNDKCQPVINVFEIVFDKINKIMYYPFKFYSSIIKFYKTQVKQLSNNMMNDEQELEEVKNLMKNMKMMMNSLNEEIDKNEKQLLEIKKEKDEMDNSRVDGTRLDQILDESINENLNFEKTMNTDIKKMDMEKMMEEQFKNIDINQMFGMIMQNMQNLIPSEKSTNDFINIENTLKQNENKEEEKQIKDDASMSDKSEDLETFLVE